MKCRRKPLKYKYSVYHFISSRCSPKVVVSPCFFFGKSTDVFGKYAIILVIIATVVVLLFYRYINSEAIVNELEK